MILASNGESWPTLRHTLHPLQYNTAVHDDCVQIVANQAQAALVHDVPLEPLHQDVVVDSVKDFLQVHIHNDSLAALHVQLCFEHGIRGASVRSEAMAVFAEAWVDLRLQHL